MTTQTNTIEPHAVVRQRLTDAGIYRGVTMMDFHLDKLVELILDLKNGKMPEKKQVASSLTA